MKNRLFVYGTLMKNHIKAIDLIDEKEMRFIGNGKIESELYDLGDYPGAVEKKGKFVFGEVYEINDSDQVLHKIDEYEESDFNNPQDSLFVRRNANVILENGTTLSAVVYYYNKSTKDSKTIPNGKWNKQT